MLHVKTMCQLHQKCFVLLEPFVRYLPTQLPTYLPAYLPLLSLSLTYLVFSKLPLIFEAHIRVIPIFTLPNLFSIVLFT